MAKSRKLRVMISSRCDDRFPAKGGRPLSAIRRELKRELESISLLGRELFEIWINEATPPQGGTWDSWDTCIEAVKECDIFLSLYKATQDGRRMSRTPEFAVQSYRPHYQPHRPRCV